MHDFRPVILLAPPSGCHGYDEEHFGNWLLEIAIELFVRMCIDVLNAKRYTICRKKNLCPVSKVHAGKKQWRF